MCTVPVRVCPMKMAAVVLEIGYLWAAEYQWQKLGLEKNIETGISQLRGVEANK